MIGQFFRSSKAGAKKGHAHIVYAHLESGRILVGNVDDHVHEVENLPDGSFRLKPDPIDGHVHDTLEVIPLKPPPKEKEDENEIVERVYSLFSTAWEGEAKSIELGRESELMYSGEQWKESTKRELEEQGRAALTINKTEKHIDDLVGYQCQQRTDLRFLPTEGGDQRVADLLNAWSKCVLEGCSFASEETDVFEDQAIPGRGVFNVYMDFSEDVQGDLRVERFPWDQVVFGPHEKRDASDCEYVIKFPMQSLGWLKRKYPKKAEEIQTAYQDLLSDKDQSHVQYAYDHYAKGEQSPQVTSGGLPMIDIALKEFRVFELQMKVYFDVSVLFDTEIDEGLPVYGWKQAELDQVEGMGLIVVNRKQKKIRITKVVGKTLLSDEYPAELPSDDFHVFPVYGKRKRGKFWGRVEPLKDPQKQVNKRSSQSIDIGNKMASYGWFYDDMTFPTDADLQAFKKNSMKAGFSLKITSAQSPPFKVEGVKFPNELVGLMEMAANVMDELGSVNPAQNAGANTSASAILQAEKATLMGSERFFDNISFAKKRLGKLLVGIAKKYYPPKRMYRIVANQNASNPVQLADTMFDHYSEDEIVQLLEDNDLSKYDVVVGEANWSPTQRIATLTILTDLMAKGAPVPFEAVMPFLDLPADVKQVLTQGVQQQQQAQQQAEANKQDSEIQKSLIGQGLFPPQTLAKYGLQPPAGAPGQMPPQAPAPEQNPMPPPNMGGPSGLM